MNKNQQIEIPGSELSLVLTSASQWYQKVPEGKKTWEVGFSRNPQGNLRVSCSAESAYLEADLNVPADLLSEFPIYLDGTYLAKIDFSGQLLTLVVPKDPFVADSRIQFKLPSANFRIPRKPGTLTLRTQVGLDTLKEYSSINFPVQAFQKLASYLQLPDSYKNNKKKNPDAFRIQGQGKTISCYSSDHFAGYLHEFYLQDSLETDPMQCLFDFLTPVLKCKKGDTFELRQTPRHSAGILKAGPVNLFWIQPNFQQALQDVPGIIKTTRQGVENCLEFQTGELLRNIEKACSLLEGQDFYDVPLLISVMQDQYTVSTHQVSKDLSFAVDGKILQPSASALKIQVQALCLKKYLSEFDSSLPFSMEVYNRSLILWQKTENQQLTFLVSTFGK